MYFQFNLFYFSVGGLSQLLIDERNCWDAHTYDEVSRLVQFRWGQQILDWTTNEEIVFYIAML
jgi:hypothetical protein